MNNHAMLSNYADAVRKHEKAVQRREKALAGTDNLRKSFAEHELDVSLAEFNQIHGTLLQALGDA